MDYSSIFPKVVSHCKEYGFLFPSSEIYDGLSAVYDYGPLGVELKNRIKELWWKAMVQLNDNVVGLDSAIFMAPQVWKASGHVDAFNDPLIDNKDSKRRYRADVLVEDYINKQEAKAKKDADKQAGKKGWAPGDEDYSRFLLGHRATRKAEDARTKLTAALEANDLDALRELILELEIACPESGSREWTEVRQFNLMFSTQLGTVAGEAGALYLRPETAQGIFVNYLNVQKTTRQKLPFGIAQVGKAFRNEIIARQFIFRMREFEQMELQFFVQPGQQAEWFNHWRETRLRWHQLLGLDPDRLRLHTHEKLSHYADAAVDIEFEFPFGFKELEGIHSRTDFDLKQHQEHSGKKLTYFDPDANEHYLPYVVETSVGLDRTVLAQLCSAYREEQAPSAEEGKSSERTVLRLPPALVPIQAAILPLVKKDGMPELAEKLYNELRFNHAVVFEEKDTIGRRYRRMDARGVPFCLTIDNQTLQDDTVTLRHRDSLEQERVPLARVAERLEQELDWRPLLRQLLA